ncbi:hypothetical protein ACFLV0_03065 [Chloroflexota bacterium]
MMLEKAIMVKKVSRWGILAALIGVPLLVITWQVLLYTEVGMANEIGEGAQVPRLSESEYLAIPQAVIDDATKVAQEMVGDSHVNFQNISNQLLASYVKASDSDVVVLFNSGGWGWNMIDETPGWSSILDGINAELEDLGHRALVLNYLRTGKGIRGCIREFIEEITRYPSKARELSRRVEFLTDHVPNIKVIVAGESTGTVVTDKTMNILRDNAQVYSIQTGTPFWHKPSLLDRTLLMNSNGTAIDTFSYGKVTTMIWATVKGLFGLLPPEEDPGTILSWLRAPGHDYSWDYPGVCSEVINFLKENFGPEK